MSMCNTTSWHLSINAVVAVHITTHAHTPHRNLNIGLQTMCRKSNVLEEVIIIYDCPFRIQQGIHMIAQLR